MRHLRGKRLLPKVFKDQNHIDEIKGIYVPFWLFDTDADADIRYRATKVRSWSDKTIIIRKQGFHGSTQWKHWFYTGSGRRIDEDGGRSYGIHRTF